MKTKQEFEAFLKALITPKVAKDINDTKIGYYIVGTLFLLFAIVTLVVALTTEIALLVIMPIFLIIGIVCTTCAKGFAYKKILAQYKSQIIAFLLQKHRFFFSEKNYLSPQTFAQFNLSNYYDKYTGEDFLRINIPKDDGSPSSTFLSMSQLYVAKTYKDSDGNKKTHIVFLGTLGIVEFDFQFPCYLAVGRNYFANRYKEERIETEDPTFNKNYKIYTNNELEAFRILTPDLMLKLTKIHQKLKGIDFVLKENKLLIYLHGKDLFTFVSHNKGYMHTVNSVYQDIEALVDIVREIQTNNKVFNF